MGHRANLVLVEHGDVTVYYDHWAACDLSDHLVLGPSHALRWVRQQEPVGDHPNGGWLDELWASGGLTADLDRQRLVWFDIPAGNDPLRRRVILALLARIWPGWTVEYAVRGLGDVAEAAGVPRGRVGDPGPVVRPSAKEDLTAADDDSGMPDALAEFLDEFTRTHASETVHPAIADHHPLTATADEVTAVVTQGAELMLHFLAAEHRQS